MLECPVQSMQFSEAWRIPLYWGNDKEYLATYALLLHVVVVYFSLFLFFFREGGGENFYISVLASLHQMLLVPACILGWPCRTLRQRTLQSVLPSTSTAGSGRPRARNLAPRARTCHHNESSELRRCQHGCGSLLPNREDTDKVHRPFFKGGSAHIRSALKRTKTEVGEFIAMTHHVHQLVREHHKQP